MSTRQTFATTMKGKKFPKKNLRVKTNNIKI